MVYEEENTISHSVSSSWASEYFLSHTFYPMGFKDENEISHSVNSSWDFKILLSRTSYHIRKGSQGWKWNIAFCKYAISHFVNSSKGLQGWKWNITFVNCYCNFFLSFIIHKWTLGLLGLGECIGLWLWSNSNLG